MSVKENITTITHIHGAVRFDLWAEVVRIVCRQTAFILPSWHRWWLRRLASRFQAPPAFQVKSQLSLRRTLAVSPVEARRAVSPLSLAHGPSLWWTVVLHRSHSHVSSALLWTQRRLPYLDPTCAYIYVLYIMINFSERSISRSNRNNRTFLSHAA